MLARASGETLEDIGRSAGLTRQRVQQIVAESEGR
jgi:DNA-directed RNA polymerase sigma subunit (sigma70/sigma32)